MINEKYFNIGVIVATALILGGLVIGGVIEKTSVMGNLAGVGFNLSLFLGAVFGLQYFQRGTGTDIGSEIFDEGNIAAGIYQGFLFLSIATIIAKGLL
jgi:hypothetical protein